MKRLIWAALAGVGVALAITGAALAGPWEDGETAYEKGDYVTALKFWLPLAEEGSAAAENNVATMYHAGQGVPQDDATADKWLAKAARSGDANAQYTLGLAYASGAGVPQDNSQAASWYLKSARQGNPAAQSMLGVCYFYGQGVPQDYVVAYMWVELGAAGYASTNPKLSQEATQSLAQFATKMSPDQVAQAKQLAAAWKPN